jgi:hypothetical protein
MGESHEVKSHLNLEKNEVPSAWWEGWVSSGQRSNIRVVAEGASGLLSLVGAMVPRWHALNGYTLQAATLFKLPRSLVVVQAFEGRIKAFAREEFNAVLLYAGDLKDSTRM